MLKHFMEHLFSNEKLFKQDQKMNRKNERWLCTHPYRGTHRVNTVMFSAAVSDQGYIMAHNLYLHSLRAKVMLM